MLKNYLLIALRTLRRQKLFSTINIVGLAVGMAVCLLVGLYVQSELSVDRFHARADRIAVIANVYGDWHSIMTPYPLATALEREVPEIERTVRTWQAGMQPVLRPDTRERQESDVLLGDAAFFQVFSFPFLKGDPTTALLAPDGAVISDQTARRYFGDENPLGKTLQIRRDDAWRSYTIRGVVANVPAASTIRFDVVLPLSGFAEQYRRNDSWQSFMFKTYVLLKEGARQDVVDRKMAALIGRYYEQEEKPPIMKALPLPAFYLSEYNDVSGFKGKTRYLYLFSSIALFVLLIAVINYLNLVIAGGIRRMREVGIRKTVGAGGSTLLGQFLTESFLTGVFALCLGWVLVSFLLPTFNLLFEKEIGLFAGSSLATLLLVSTVILGIGVLAGAYPALIVSRVPTVPALHGGGHPGGRNWLQKSLVVVQFTLSIALIAASTIAYRQIRYVQTKDLGFRGEQVLAVKLPTELLWQRREALQERIGRHPGISQMSAVMGAPGYGGIQMGVEPDEISPDAHAEGMFFFSPVLVDPEFIETMGIRLVAGRGFSTSNPDDPHQSLLLNETAVRRLGWAPQESVGKQINLGNNESGEIVGVTEDFHMQSLQQAIPSTVLQLKESGRWSTQRLLMVRLTGEHIPEAIADITREMKRLAPDEPVEYEFLDDHFDAMYRSEEQLRGIFTVFAVLAVGIACMGLFGLAANMAERRTKEIGIRKVLGATVSRLVLLFSKEFVLLVLVAFGLGAPLANLAMNRWLEGFAYRITPGAGIFLFTGSVALLVALISVGVHALRTALANPVRSLRYE